MKGSRAALFAPAIRQRFVSDSLPLSVLRSRSYERCSVVEQGVRNNGSEALLMTVVRVVLFSI
jgi:hypothetical protein